MDKGKKDVEKITEAKKVETKNIKENVIEEIKVKTNQDAG